MSQLSDEELKEAYKEAYAELLNEDTAVVHIEKANPEIEGLYAMISEKFVESDWREVKYINREQDLGEPGLRQAKLSYHPEHFVEKYQIRLSENKK